MVSMILKLPHSMIPMVLLSLSVLTLAILLERSFTLYLRTVRYGRRERQWIRGQIESCLPLSGACRPDPADLLRIASGIASPLNRGIRKLLEMDLEKPGFLEEHSEESLLELSLYLKRWLGSLGTISTIAPLFGLLGTVTGMIRSFHAFGATGLPGGNLMGGVDEALVTTAMGLVVGIPAFAFYNLFGNTINTLLADSETLQRRIITLRTGEPVADSAKR